MMARLLSGKIKKAYLKFGKVSSLLHHSFTPPSNPKYGSRTLHQPFCFGGNYSPASFCL
ncbi:hypothetical protein D0Y65_007541 [Glycine soja]|uniref:Uncharacterized protein n=2 Tax=Glycine subgen. Soja TaxID=1462606 RepID=K7KFU1_SOYBN|nr:hypothetical protein JHK87_007701 [Glycine soja]RZC21323.1 hypothetical protein D0Y65_007541 [Glycine soja]